MPLFSWFANAWRHAGLLVLLWGLGHAALAAPPPAGRTKFNFNPGWKVQVGERPGAEAAFDDAQWKSVTLPYAWNEDEAFRKDIKDLSTGVAWYRKHFRLPAGAAGQKVFVEFEGVRLAGEFWLNGHRLGLHENGVMAVGYDLTPYLKPAPADNVLAVRTDNDWDYQEKASGQAQAKDAFNITELEAPKTATAVTDQAGPPGTLGLVEVEVY